MPPHDDFLRLEAAVIAMIVRNAMEDFHTEHLTDEQMAMLNPIIRNAIYTGLYVIQHGDTEPWCQRFFEYHMNMIPPYWEAPELMDGARAMREKEQAERDAKLQRKARRNEAG